MAPVPPLRRQATFAARLRFPGEHFRLLEARAVGEKSRAVLDAADMWLVAVETRELLGETASVQIELEEMEAKLADAAMPGGSPAAEKLCPFNQPVPVSWPSANE
jgi:hypothetical protein